MSLERFSDQSDSLSDSNDDEASSPDKLPALKKYGPIAVDIKDTGGPNSRVKFFTFCSKQFGHDLSRRDLHRCFSSGEVKLNGTHVAATGERTNPIESLQLKIGDQVEIYRNLDSLDHSRLQSISFSVLFMNHDIAVITKDAGINSTKGKLYDRAIKEHCRRAWQRNSHEDDMYQLYYIKKNIPGLTILCSTADCLLKLRELFHVPDIDSDRLTCTSATSLIDTTAETLTVTYSCVICGKVGDIGSSVTLSTPHRLYPQLRLHIINVGRCRFAEYISLVEITIANVSYDSKVDTIDIPAAADIVSPRRPEHFRWLSFPSLYLRDINYALLLAGHPIVGDANIVKKSKGLFACISKVQLSGPLVAVAKDDETFQSLISAGIVNDPTTVEIEQTDTSAAVTFSLKMPNKFAKLFSRENEFWGKDQLKRLLLHGELHVSQAEREIIEEGLPIEYITGTAFFHGISFHVSRDVMIPKKSSEALVEEGVALFHDFFRGQQNASNCYRSVYRVLDLGTGSGCLLLSIMKRCLEIIQSTSNTITSGRKDQYSWTVEGVGIDISNAALDIARENAELLGLSSNCGFVHCSFDNLSKLEETFKDDVCDGYFDLVISNPPYSSEKEHHRISSASRLFEPSVALFCRGGPLQSYRAINESLTTATATSGSLSLFKSHALFIFEVGAGQHDRVVEIFEDDGLLKFSHHRGDFNGLVRCLVFHRA